MQALRISAFGPDERERRLQPSRHLTCLLLVLILAGAAFARLHRLGDLPAGFYCDEAALGYNAFSLLETGRDETGTFLPLYVWSFDTSYKNPVFIYSAVPLVAFFGLDEFAVRLTSALYGTATVAAIFFLGRTLMGNWAGLLAAAFLAVCPWHIHFSRIAFELITFPFFFLAATACLARSACRTPWLLAAAALFGFSLYTYAIAKLFVPLFLAGFALFNAPALLRHRRAAGLALGVFALVSLPLVRFDLTHPSRAGQYFGENTILNEGLSPGDLIVRFARQYGAFLSPTFLFREPDPLPRHAVREHGELYDFFAPLLLLGLLTTIGRPDRKGRLLLLWLLLYPIGPALMTEIPSASRGLIGAPAFCLLAALGASLVLRLVGCLRVRPRTAVAVQCAAVLVGAVAVAPQVIHYWQLYTRDYPTYSASFYTGFQFGHREVVRYFLEHRDEYDRMVLGTRANNQPQTFLLFYSAFPPAAFQRRGMAAVESATGMTIGRPDERFFYEDGGRLLFAARDFELPLFTGYDLEETVTSPGGKPAFLIVEPHGLKNFVDNWWIIGPFPFRDSSPPPEFDPEAPPATGPGGRPWQWYGWGSALIDLGAIVKSEGEWNCAWAVNFVHSPEAKTMRIFAGFDVTGEVWVNGEPVLVRKLGSTDELEADSWAGTALLRGGLNAVAVRSCASVYAWRFHFRLTELDGTPVPHKAWRY